MLGANDALMLQVLKGAPGTVSRHIEPLGDGALAQERPCHAYATADSAPSGRVSNVGRMAGVGYAEQAPSILLAICANASGDGHVSSSIISRRIFSII